MALQGGCGAGRAGRRQGSRSGKRSSVVRKQNQESPHTCAAFTKTAAAEQVYINMYMYVCIYIYI